MEGFPVRYHVHRTVPVQTFVSDKFIQKRMQGSDVYSIEKCGCVHTTLCESPTLLTELS